ncbi:hypothetical protein OWV82_016322 [Melia azedarach]|uniref:Uncharacterized protein n=1 Tax=Melia azedarach TaxID=155640 RepID=A0ACC1XFL8_MELAZ|nr:hypothetical protein OWV82_016322 [Melia azedarach]
MREKDQKADNDIIGVEERNGKKWDSDIIGVEERNGKKWDPEGRKRREVQLYCMRFRVRTIGRPGGLSCVSNGSGD